MKKGARLVNAARGELIDEALWRSAEKRQAGWGSARRVCGRAPKNSPLTELPNVIATPHVAGSTTEAQEEVGRRWRCRCAIILRRGDSQCGETCPRCRRISIAAGGRTWRCGTAGSFVARQRRRGRHAFAFAMRARLRRSGRICFAAPVLTGLLNVVLDEEVNVVNAPQVARHEG